MLNKEELDITGGEAKTTPLPDWLLEGVNIGTLVITGPGTEVGGTEVGGTKVGGTKVGGTEVGGTEVGGTA